MIHQANLRAVEQAGFKRVRGRQNHFAAELRAGDQRGQELGGLALRASQGQFAVELAMIECARIDLAVGGQNADRNR